MKTLLFLSLFLVAVCFGEAPPVPESEDDFEQSGEHVPCWPTAAQLIKVKETQKFVKERESCIQGS